MFRSRGFYTVRPKKLQVADVPRSRVYETMDRLQKRGLVEIHQAEPKAYQSVSVDTALRTLRAEYDAYIQTLDTTLRNKEPTYRRTVQGVWAINSHEQITGRIVDFISEASEEIALIILAEKPLDTDCFSALVEADNRGISIYIGTTVEPVRDRITTADIDAVLFETELIEWFATMSEWPRIGRLQMVDQGPVLVTHSPAKRSRNSRTKRPRGALDRPRLCDVYRMRVTYHLKKSLEDAVDSLD